MGGKYMAMHLQVPKKDKFLDQLLSGWLLEKGYRYMYAPVYLLA
jgi:hypothetical protein